MSPPDKENPRTLSGQEKLETYPLNQCGATNLPGSKVLFRVCNHKMSLR